jgi:hypothetical protein
MKMMLGLSFRAIWNRVLIVLSDYPTYLDIRSEDDMLKKVPFSISVAQAFAKYVLHVPGGYILSMDVSVRQKFREI